MAEQASRCPICNKDARSRGENGAFPFCSPRCKMVDLGKWLDEAYRLPAEDEATLESSPSEEKPS
jgi:endogenous inhibitor of DNA gyrase (YacG/DUF329 family)